MVYSFQAETVLYTLAAVGIAAILREGWLWLFRRPSAEKAIPMLLSLTFIPPVHQNYIIRLAQFWQGGVC